MRHATIVLLTLPLTGGASATTACGKRATDADCRLIVDKSVELQMKEMSHNDVSAIAQREERVRVALEDQIRSCESRHVTDKTMACVRNASTMKELDACLR
ncbi:MAG: hypothetical protein M3O46_09955 [Myxococcota bacterium]|nr:hypothetical protein [Myxococcota bacterium]